MCGCWICAQVGDGGDASGRATVLERTSCAGIPYTLGGNLGPREHQEEETLQLLPNLPSQLPPPPPPQSPPPKAVSAAGPWFAADTWFEVAGAFYNARTGVLQLTAPDGLREDGTARLSAAAAGAWAVPFTTPPPRLPPELQPPMSSTVLVPEVEYWGDNGLLFTAPHGVNLLRDGKPEHMPEDFTTYLARAWAARTRGAAITWPVKALAWVTATELPLPGARDPNYLLDGEAESNCWVRALVRARSEHARGLHIDVHGKRDDLPGERDCDVGVGAIRQRGCDAAADEVAAACCTALARVLTPAGFSVDDRPRLQGAWRSVPRRTLTQSATRLGYTCVQLELGYRLRKALSRDRSLCWRVGDALAASAPVCIEACSKQLP